MRTIVALTIAVAALTSAPLAQSQQERDAAFKEIQSLEQQGRHTQAASKLGTYLTRFVQSDTPLYVVLQFRLGFNRELAGDLGAAAETYCACLAHPLATHATAVFAGTPVQNLAQQRVGDLHHACGRSAVISTIITRSGKGGISLVRANLPAPYTSDESLTLVSRMRSVESIAEAEAMRRSLFASAPAMGYGQSGGLVVAVRGRSDDQAQAYARSLAAVAQVIRARHFGGRAASRALYVYASDGDEQAGRELSTTVHFRSMDGLEAYYQPLDHSVVLRKADPRMGTAAHELTHALMSDDFPYAPRWLDEGIASLEEEHDGRRPLDNYRLYYLRSAIDRDRLPLLREVLHSTHDGWYDDRAPVFAGYARYLALYLFERNASLDTVYERLKSSPGDRRAPELSMQVLSEATGRDEHALEQDLVRFVEARDVDALAGKWGSLRRPAGQWVSQIPPRVPEK